MHTQEVFRTLQVSSQQVDRNGRSVRRDDRIFANFVFQLSQNHFFDFRVFNNRFNHSVDIAEFCIRQSRTDAVQGFTHLQRLHFLTLYALGQQLVRFVQAQLDTRFIDVFHHDRGAFQRRLEGNTATHDASAQHSSFIGWLSSLVEFFCFLLQQLVVHEQTDQSVAFRSFCQLCKAFGFHFQCFITTHVGRFLHGFDGNDWRWVLTFGLTSNETFSGFENHHLFHRVQLQLGSFFFTTGLPVDFASDGGFQHGNRLFFQFVSSNNGINCAVFQCFLRLVLSAHADPFDRIVSTDNTWQTDSTAKTRHQTQFNFWQTDLGLVRHNAQVGRQTHFEAATQSDAINSSQGRNGQIFDSTEDFVGFEAPGHDFFFALLEGFTEFGDIRADDKYVFTRCN